VRGTQPFWTCTAGGAGCAPLWNAWPGAPQDPAHWKGRPRVDPEKLRHDNAFRATLGLPAL